MKIAAADRAVERINMGPSATFSMKMTAKAARILSSGLYKDKIRAIIRELCANAHDAHVAAGKKDVPFRVHLPNAMEPFFRVSDDGIGLDETEITTIYTTYFESTKTDSNDFVGALGLGSKSPFSYVDAFTVTSRKDGFQTTYTAYMDEDGMPSLSRIGEPQPYSGSNGIDVTIPVTTQYDCNAFAERASEVLEHYAVEPEVTGWPDFKIVRTPKIMGGTFWSVMDRTGHGRAIMGTVAYPIDQYSCDAGDWEVFAAPIDIVFPIGAVDVTAGREELSYDARITKPALKAAADAIRAELPAALNELFNQCPTEWEARILFGKLLRYGSPLAFAAKGVPVVWNGIEITTNDIKLNIKDTPTQITMYGRRRGRVDRQVVNGNHGTNAVLTCSPTMLIMRDDLGRGSTGRVRQAMADGLAPNIVVIKTTDEHYAQIEKSLAGANISFTSTLQPLPRKPRAVLSMRVMTYSDRGMGLSNANTVESDAAEGGWYVVTRNGVVDGYHSWTAFTSVWSEAIVSGVISENERIHFVPRSLVNRLDPGDGWLDLCAETKSRAEEYASDTSYRAAMIRVKSATTVASELPGRFERTIEQLSNRLHPEHPLISFKNSIRAWNQIPSSMESMHRLVKAMGLEIEATDADYAPLRRTANVLVNRYPLLSGLANWQLTDTEARAAIDYIVMVDRIRPLHNEPELLGDAE